MKFRHLICLGAFALAACAREPEPMPVLPEGVATKDFTFVDESYLRGVRGSRNTSPRGRPAAILEVTYGLRCIASDAPANVNRAKKVLDETFVVAPFYFQNPRERGQWNRQSARVLDGTGCILNGFSYTSKTTDVMQTTMWALRNNVPPAR